MRREIKVRGKNAGRNSLLLVVALALASLSCAPSTDTVSVSRVIDGDTIVVDGNVHVRYIGMNAPEVSERCGNEATEVDRRLVGGKAVRMEKDVSETDRYGRLLRYVWVGDTFINAEIVRLGYAEAKEYPPDLKYRSLFRQLEGEAKAAKIGMWAAGPCPAP